MRGAPNSCEASCYCCGGAGPFNEFWVYFFCSRLRNAKFLPEHANDVKRQSTGVEEMKLVFPMPHMLRLKATCQPWEAAVTGHEQIRFAKWAEKLGYEMIAVPEHHVVPAGDVVLSVPHYFNGQASMA